MLYNNSSYKRMIGSIMSLLFMINSFDKFLRLFHAMLMRIHLPNYTLVYLAPAPTHIKSDVGESRAHACVVYYSASCKLRVASSELESSRRVRNLKCELRI